MLCYVFFNKTYPEAVQFLLGRDNGEVEHSIPKSFPKKEFVLPMSD